MKKDEKKYLNIVRHYESCLKEHGDNHLGVGWSSEKDNKKRFEVMLAVMAEDTSKKIQLLDFGCGTAGLYEHIKAKKMTSVAYSGLDISKNFTDIAKKKYPDLKFYNCDVLCDGQKLPLFDYDVMNGVFTQKRDLTFEEMFQYFKQTVGNIFSKTKKAMAFNVMSKQVDWENEGNFYLSFDQLAGFLNKNISKNFVFRHDYGLYEYTTYIYK